MSTGARGAKRERDVVRLLQADGWVAFRAPASLGVADVVALKAGSRPRMVEVKANATRPYDCYLPRDRARLSEAAKQAGADAFLCWWPPDGKGPRWIPEAEWPLRPS